MRAEAWAGGARTVRGRRRVAGRQYAAGRAGLPAVHGETVFAAYRDGAVGEPVPVPGR